MELLELPSSSLTQLPDGQPICRTSESIGADAPSAVKASETDLPNRFICKIGGEWRPISHFSKKNLAKIEGMNKVDPKNTGMVCRTHSGQPVAELRCKGPCGLDRPLDEFSSASRINGVYVGQMLQYYMRDTMC
jgi:hypothetical protein